LLVAAALFADLPGHVIVAKTTGNALLIWDATPEIAAIVSAKLSDADAEAEIAHDALRVLAEGLPLTARANSIAVRVIYERTGDVSPVYGSPTFAGVERYAILTLDARDALSDRDRWRELDSHAPLPHWIAYQITGRLPPR
jgi:hypothetical protein